MAYNSITPISLPYPQPVTALSFDPVSNVLWSGSNSGYIFSFCGAEGLRGISYRAGDLAVQKIASGESVIRALCISGNGMGSWTKGGLNRFFYNGPNSLTTFSSQISSSHPVAAASVAPEILFLNAMTGTVLRQTQVPSVITHLEFSHSLLLSGATDGFVRAHDPRTGVTRNGGSESAVKAHANGITGLQTIGSFVFTIGLSMRQGRPFPDPLVKVYDLRNMRPLSPIPFSSGPAFIDVIPKRSSTIAVASNLGLINIVDVSNPNLPSEFYQLNPSSYLTSFAVSPTATYLAAGDAEGIIHLSCQGNEEDSLPFNGFDGQPVEWGDAPAALPDIHWTDSTPLNMIGMPHYKTQLLSSWTHQFMSTPLNYPPPPKIPPQILNSMKVNDSVAYAALPKELKGKRNIVTLAPPKRKGRFRSGKAHDEPETPVYDDTSEDVPKIYRQVEIEYSKFGVEDFDFGFYNKTPYSGLETHILNCYTNSIIQILHYSSPIRTVAKSHIKTDCPREYCLLCELGFVVRMLEDADGKNLQASNFCKTVGVLAQASNAIDLIDYGQDTSELGYVHMIQSFHRFLIDHLCSEGNAFPANPVVVKKPEPQVEPAAAPITQLMGIDAKNIITCLYCKATREKDNLSHIVDLVYPRKALSNEPEVPSDLVSILQNSLTRQITHKASCQSCKRFSTFASGRSIATKDLPPILAVNANVFTEESMKFWLDTRSGTFLQPTIELHGQVAGANDPAAATYELRAVVVNIVEKEDLSHLVAIIKVPEAEKDESPWYLFNDFSVRNIPEEEALSFPAAWKVPAVLHFERVDVRENLDFSGLPNEDDYSILYRDTSISINRDTRLIKHECLSPEERPTPGSVVAIDAEFVSMQQEESEYRSDGSHRVLRPARMSLARVSVLRGSGPKQGVPFIDDHIHTSEAIVDYLTEFSGIRFGDLDPVRSPYTLTPLKVVYKKLRLLVDSGCIFIGHGLSKDFRIINIFVPPDQVLDTVDVYFRPDRQRRLSLRFLAWFILQEVIQTETHDSIEDARCALDLYNTHLDFLSEGTFDQKLDELYKAGKQFNFKPPPLAGQATSTPQLDRATPPIPASQSVESNSSLESGLAHMYPSSHSGTPVPSQTSNPFLPTFNSTWEEKAYLPGFRSAR